MNNEWLLPFGENLIFLTSEIALTDGKKTVNDILAIDNDCNLCIIELKSIRDNKVKQQTKDFEARVKVETHFFEDLIYSISGKKWNGVCRKIAVWPKAKGQVRENKYSDVEIINYIYLEGSNNYKFE